MLLQLQKEKEMETVKAGQEKRVNNRETKRERDRKRELQENSFRRKLS